MTDTTADTPPGAAPCAIMFHDGACPLCSLEVAHYQRVDTAGAVTFVDAASAESEALLAAHGLTRAQALARLHVITAEGDVASGARAFVALWRRLPGWRRLAPIAGAPPIIWLLELGYRAFLPVRPLLAGLLTRLRGPLRR